MSIEKWTAALRSGKYKKGVGYLHLDDNYCCLGVACDLYAQEHPIEVKEDKEFGFSYAGCNRILPVAVRDWLGLWDRAGEFTGSVKCSDRMFTKLTGINDGTELSFSEIADIIEANLHQLVKDETPENPDDSLPTLPVSGGSL